MIIYKYPLKVVEKQIISIPEDFQPLSLQIQNSVPVLWVKVNPTNQIKFYEILMTGTGIETDYILYKYLYLGTVQLYSFVWHYFLGEKRES